MIKKVNLFLIIILTVLWIWVQPAYSQQFSDISGNWARPYIQYLADQGIVTGFSDGTFRPNWWVTRADFTKMVNLAFNSNFADYQYAKLEENDNITRQEAAYIMAQALNLDTDIDHTPFSDDAKIDKRYRGAVAAMQKAGYLNGYSDGTFKPNRNIFKAEAAVMIFSGMNSERDSNEVINVRDFGAIGDSVTDDTEAFNKAIDYAFIKGGGIVYASSGTYLINVDVSIKLRDNVKLHLAPNAVLQAKPTDTVTNRVIQIDGQNNVELVGGTIIGDRHSHLGSDGEWGRGIEMCGSNNVYIADVSIMECWGDGIYIGDSYSNQSCDNVLVENFSVDESRRSGITITCGKNVTIKNGRVSKSNANGINLEPNYSFEVLDNILIDNVTTISNGLAGFSMCFCKCFDSNDPFSIVIRNCTDQYSREKIHTTCPYFRTKNVDYSVN